MQTELESLRVELAHILDSSLLIQAKYSYLTDLRSSLPVPTQKVSKLIL